MKKIVLLSLLAALCIAVGITGTLAVITAEESSENVVTMGNLKIAAIQTTLVPGNETPQPFKGGFKLVPGREYSWILEVENCGNQDAYIRIGIDKVIELADGVVGNPDTSLLQLAFNETDWQYKDGYYYYNAPLLAGEKTAPLFTSFVFSKDAGNMYQGSTATADIHIFGTQVKNNGADATEASGWLLGE